MGGPSPDPGGKKRRKGGEEQDTSREENAERALRCAAFGLLPILFFLEIYATWLLLRVWLSREALDGKRRRLAWTAAALNLAVIGGLFLLVGGIFWGVSNTPANWYDLRTYRHPQRMVGVWQRQFREEEGAALEVLELHANGRFIYRQEGATETEMEGSGTWGYHDNHFLFRIDRFAKGRWEHRGLLISWRLDAVSEDVMKLESEAGLSTYHRQQLSGRK